MASSSWPWATVPPDLLRFITSDGFGLPLESYSSVRGVCTAWRSALPPPTPLLLAVSGFDAPRHRQVHPGQLVSASLLTADPDHHHHRSPFRLSDLPTGGDLVGSSNGWIAVDPIWPGIFLINPLAAPGGEVVLEPLRDGGGGGEPVLKVAFAPNPTPGDYTAVAICGPRRLAYATTRDDAATCGRRWTLVDVAVADERDRLVDLVYDAGASGKAYCVTAHGDVHVFHAPGSSCRRRRPRVSPLHPQPQGAKRGAAASGLFAPPYDEAARLTGAAKSIFLSGGRLYQVWRNAAAAVSWRTPEGGRFGVAKDEVFVLKYDPKRRRPCWNAVNDLGGCSVFVGKNSPVVLRPEDATGVRPNCVYWINEESRFQPMVFDMATRKSTMLPFGAKGESREARRPLCWFFLNDKVASIDGDGSKVDNDE
ncbi:unnamed protein product [Urochloa decumbens]|uniref:KIB1-4 beta-propeller domain-containing protein n=1 Tax=Urochloa decumbens TaxID=240449 RepID=A0ABC9C9R1_9POAL